MRLIALLMLPSLTFAAPVPQQPERIEVKLFAQNQDVLEITIQNNGKEPLVLPYRVTPFEHLVVELKGEKGKRYKVEHSGEHGAGAMPKVLRIPAGGSKTLSLHTCHYLPQVVEGDEKITITARLKLDGRTITSKPLTVDP